jgi:Predicted protein tyrosine phosphatase
MQAIAVMSKTDAAKKWDEFDAVITIEDTSALDGLRVTVPQLVLQFDDVVEVVGRLVPPEERHLYEALAWARKWASARLLIHCEMGISRSAAVALSVLADRYGSGREAQAVSDLFDIRPVASCNPRLLGMADKILGRGGRLVEAYQEADERRFSCGFFIPPKVDLNV